MTNFEEEQQKLFERALAQFSKKQYSEALLKFEQITLKSLQVLKYYYIGLSYVQIGDFENALVNYKKIHEIPRSVQGVEYDRIMYGLYINMGSVLQVLAKKHGVQYYLEAQKCYKFALEINETDERVWNNLGNVQIELETYNQAIQSFEKAIEINPEFPEAYYCLSLVYEYKRDFDTAIQYLKKELKWKPNNKTILNRLAGLLFGIGRMEEAKGFAEKLLNKYPNDKNGLKNLALINYNLKNYDIAYQYYQKLLNLFPDFDPKETDSIFKDLEKRISNL